MRKLISHDKITGRKTYFDFSDPDPDVQFHVVTEFEVDDIVAANKARANEYRPGSMIGNTQRHMTKVADVPNEIYVKLVSEFGQPHENPKAWKRWLNDSDNRDWRTGGGYM